MSQQLMARCIDGRSANLTSPGLQEEVGIPTWRDRRISWTPNRSPNTIGNLSLHGTSSYMGSRMFSSPTTALSKTDADVRGETDTGVSMENIA